jgi:SAM-dependent methyltransferase
MSLAIQIQRQFGRPHGLIGRVAGAVMATRPSNQTRNRWAVDLLNVQPLDRVLEIGFGPGLALAALAARVGQGRVVGLDHSPLMVSRAAQLNRMPLTEGRMQLFAGGLELLPSIPGPFDKALSVNVVQFWPDRIEALAAIRDILAPCGLVATAYMPRHSGATAADASRMAADLESKLASLGFASIRTKVLYLRPVPVVCVLGEKGR